MKLKTFTLAELLKELGVQNTQTMRRQVRAHLAWLVDRKMFKHVEGGKDKGFIYKWEYIEPEGPGSAALTDIARRPSAPERAVKDAVAGTGQKIKANNPAVQALLNACLRLGAEVRHADNGHFAITFKGKRVLISSTPSGSRSVLNDRARLRRAGLNIVG